MNISVGLNGSLSLNAYPHELQHDMKDMVELTIGPSDNYDGIKACLTYNSPRESKPGYQRARGVSLFDIFPRIRYFQEDFHPQLEIGVNALAGEWFVFIHERGHFVHNSMYTFGSDQTFTTLIDETTTITVIHEINRKEVTYLNDPRTPCQPKPRDVDMNICIQRYIENKIECQLPWHTDKTTLPKCIETGKYQDFLTSYEEIASLTGFSIAKTTGCLPSCKLNEFSVIVKDRVISLDEWQKFIGYFFYPGGQYTKKLYSLTYDFTSYIADAGGLIGLFLGYSMLSIYDGLKNAWKNKKI